MPKKVTILGSTGSIGTQTLEVIENLPDFEIAALTANKNIDLLESQIKNWNPQLAVVMDEKSAIELSKKVPHTEIMVGLPGLLAACTMSDVSTVVSSLVGRVGLEPTVAAIRAKKTIALANKETLVAAGELMMREVSNNEVAFYPVDSEHSAIFQCLQGNEQNKPDCIYLTASGGPFRTKTAEELQNVTVEEALKHPNWNMGAKITVDSATMMNKGLEFIEAKWLFDISPDNIEIVINRESVLHSAVEFDDYSVIGQLGTPDMKIPIQYAILYPERLKCDVKRLSFTEYGTLSFYIPDYNTFDCLSGCIKAIRMGSSYPCIVNSINEEAVKLFLQKKISFLRIGELVMESLDYFPKMNINCYEDVVKADTLAREFVLNKM